MMSRREVGLIVTAMGASTGILRRPDVAVMVAVVLLTYAVDSTRPAPDIRLAPSHWLRFVRGASGTPQNGLFFRPFSFNSFILSYLAV